MIDFKSKLSIFGAIILRNCLSVDINTIRYTSIVVFSINIYLKIKTLDYGYFITKKENL